MRVCCRMKPDLWSFEKKALKAGYSKIAGVDEAGRGPLAGPVVAAAVILPASLPVAGINDSKKLTPGKREHLFEEIYQHAVAVGIGIVDPSEIDRINILQASRFAMLLAVENLFPKPDYLLVDGTFPIASQLPQEPIPKGDTLSISIAAASIIAKVTRDSMMAKYHQEYPRFGFAQNKGYPTKTHKAAIQKYGCCPIHRKSFKGVKEHLE